MRRSRRANQRRPSMSKSVQPAGERIVELRIAKALTQMDLAVDASVSERTLSKAEAGQPVSVSTITQVARALDVHPADIQVQSSASVDNGSAIAPEEDTISASLTRCANNTLILNQIASGRALLRLAEDVFEFEYDFDIDPKADEVRNAMKEIRSVLSGVIHCEEAKYSESPHPPTYDDIEISARLSCAIDVLAESNVSVLVGVYRFWSEQSHPERGRTWRVLRLEFAKRSTKQIQRRIYIGDKSADRAPNANVNDDDSPF
jgi:transcriptional regulator with XRE-family HTH domain